MYYACAYITYNIYVYACIVVLPAWKLAYRSSPRAFLPWLLRFTPWLFKSHCWWSAVQELQALIILCVYSPSYNDTFPHKDSSSWLLSEKNDQNKKIIMSQNIQFCFPLQKDLMDKIRANEYVDFAELPQGSRPVPHGGTDYFMHIRITIPDLVTWCQWFVWQH